MYRNLLWPPWGNVVLLGFALVLARVVTEYILGRNDIRGEVKNSICGRVMDAIGSEMVRVYRKITLLGVVIVMNLVVFLGVWVFYSLISFYRVGGRPFLVGGDVLSMFVLGSVLWCGFSLLGEAISSMPRNSGRQSLRFHNRSPSKRKV